MADSARAIENLVYTYAERIDAGDLAGVADLFRHGRIQSAGMVFEGTAQVRAMYEGAVRLHGDGTPRTRHVTTNVAIDVDDHAGSAGSRAYFTVLQQVDDLPLHPIVAGRYHDTFHLVDGGWWFDTREVFIDLAGDVSHHLLFDL